VRPHESSRLFSLPSGIAEPRCYRNGRTVNSRTIRGRHPYSVLSILEQIETEALPDHKPCCGGKSFEKNTIEPPSIGLWHLLESGSLIRLSRFFADASSSGFLPLRYDTCSRYMSFLSICPHFC
jgi:hypothetical protein